MQSEKNLIRGKRKKERKTDDSDVATSFQARGGHSMSN